MTLLAFLATAFGIVVWEFFIADAYACMPWIARWIVRCRTSKLSTEVGDRLREEWLAELDAIPANAVKIAFALGLFGGRREIEEAASVYQSEGMPHVVVTAPAMMRRIVTPGEAAKGDDVVEIKTRDHLKVNVSDTVGVSEPEVWHRIEAAAASRGVAGQGSACRSSERPALVSEAWKRGSWKRGSWMSSL